MPIPSAAPPRSQTTTTRQADAAPATGDAAPKAVEPQTAEPVASAATPRRVNPDAQQASRRAQAQGDPRAQLWRATLAVPVPELVPGTPPLPAGYGSLQKLAGRLGDLDERFLPATPDGRSALALALAIGGTEVYGKGATGTDFFTRAGGTGKKMLGFAQFNTKYHADKTRTPESYTRFLGDILTGEARMPNSARAQPHASLLSEAVANGEIHDGAGFRSFLKTQGFGGSNWQGIDDGWKRTPGLADALVRFLQE